MALKTHLLTHAHALGDWTLVGSMLDAIPDVENWEYFLPNSFLVVTELDADSFTNVISSYTQRAGRFIVVTLSDLKPARDYSGLLGKDQWDLIRRPAPMPPPAPAVPPPVPPLPPPPPTAGKKRKGKMGDT